MCYYTKILIGTHLSFRKGLIFNILKALTFQYHTIETCQQIQKKESARNLNQTKKVKEKTRH